MPERGATLGDQLRLILISNRVAIPTDTSHRAGGLEVVLAPTLKRYEGVWFGWSGHVVPPEQVSTKTIQKSSQSYVLTDLSEGSSRILQRLCQQRAVAHPALPHRPGGVKTYSSRQRRLIAGRASAALPVFFMALAAAALFTWRKVSFGFAH